MKKINSILALSVIFSTTALAADCTSVGKNLNPYKGMVASITDVTVKEEQMLDRVGLLFEWNYRFSDERPTYSKWTFISNADNNTSILDPSKIKDGDVFLYVEVKDSVVKEKYDRQGVKGYYPVILAGEGCQFIEVDISTSEKHILW